MSANGCYRACDHLLLSTVSNWAGTAFELAAHAMDGRAGYLAALGRAGRSLADVEKAVLEAVCAQVRRRAHPVHPHAPPPAARRRICRAQPAGSVDGCSPALVMSVDGLAFEPEHRDMYEMLAAIAADGQ